MSKLNLTVERWAAVKPDAFLTGSIVQARNVLEMATQDIALLAAERDRIERNRDMWKGQSERQADQLRARQWQPFATAPRDGTPILAVVAPNRIRHLKHLAGRTFVIRHEGRTTSDYDLGWAVYPGFGGASDNDFSHWQPVPTLSLSPHDEGRTT